MPKPKTPDNEKSIKKSVSFPPDQWKFLERETGETGAYSKVVQKAVRLLMQETPPTYGKKKKP